MTQLFCHQTSVSLRVGLEASSTTALRARAMRREARLTIALRARALRREISQLVAAQKRGEVR